ncbi:MAG: hypothetical protein EHM56_08010 [Chloroflexi bacterium]|nr:MAG: hypothetical protein EHM56_08010 [Chloroflexota bacterium]
MAIYRALKDLDAGKTLIRRGQVFMSGTLPGAVVDRLAELGKIAPVSTPPLAVLPGWKARAGKIAPEIETAGDFLEADSARLAKVLKVSPDRIEPMKLELAGWLSVPQGNSKH